MSTTPGVTKPSLRRFTLRIIKLILSLVCFGFDAVSNLLCRILRINQPGTCVVLYYHAVPGGYRSRFEEQMRIVTSESKIVDLRNIKSPLPDTRTIAITFDDALESFFDNAVPVLLRLKIPATVFVVSEALGTKPEWGESYYASDERVMSVEQLRSLPELIVVGSHTLTHRNLTDLAPEAAIEEIANSREKLESILHRQISLFSFPYGALNDWIVSRCQEAGYERVFSTSPVLAFATEDQFVVGRVSVDPWDWRLEFRLKIMGAYRWDAKARNAIAAIRAWFSSNKQNPGEPAVGRAARSKSAH